MGLSTAGKNKILDAIGATHISAHTADPGDNGANEVSGGGYARQAVTWNAAAAANLDSSNAPALSIPAATTITHLGMWDALSGGVYLGSFDITDEAFGSAGTYTATDLDINL